jgi:Tfp pilus assembly protein PilN
MIKINLLPLKDKLTADARREASRALFSSLMIGLLLAGLHGFLATRESQAARGRLATLNIELSKLEPRVRAIRSARRTIEQDQKRLTALKRLEQRRVCVPHFMASFSKDLFPYGWVEGLRLEQNRLSANVLVSSAGAASSLRQKIDKYPCVVSVSLSKPEGVQTDGGSFLRTSLEVELGLKEGRDGE